MNTEAASASDAHHRLEANLSRQIAREYSLKFRHLLLFTNVEQWKVMNRSTAELANSSWKEKVQQ